MSKRRSDWQNRPQERFVRWMRVGYLALDEAIEDSVLQPGEAPPEVDPELAAQHQEAALQHRHDRDLALDRLAQYDLYAWTLTKGRRLIGRLHVLLSLLLGGMIIIFLLGTVAHMPRFGAAYVPANIEVITLDIVLGLAETGATNMVDGMILDYRAFDSLGESTLLFIAACAVLILLRIDLDDKGQPTQQLIAEESDDRHYEPKNDRILQGTAILLTPILLLFGLYVILNGHLSPGGGFSGGAIVSSGLILYLNAFGFKKAGRFFSYKTFQWVSFGALGFYGVAKAYSFYCGANGLESHIPLGTPGAILSGGLIMPLNIAVGLVVACTMYIFYALFRKGGL